MLKSGKTIWYCHITDEIWEMQPSNSIDFADCYYAVTWNDIVFIHPERMEAFIYIGKL